MAAAGCSRLFPPVRRTLPMQDPSPIHVNALRLGALASKPPHRWAQILEAAVRRIGTSRSTLPATCASAIQGMIHLCFTLSTPTLSMQSLYPGNDARRLAAFSTSDLATKLSHCPYLAENNRQITNPFFPFLYNGFRVPRNVPLAATLWRASQTFLRPRLAESCRSPRPRSLTTE